MKVLTCAGMAALDDAARKEYGIPGPILMENASRSAAEYILRELWRGDATGSGFTVVVAGKGNNGGDALVAARHLWTAGKRDLHVLLLQKDLGEMPRLHLGILSRLGIPSSVYSEEPSAAPELLSRAAWIVDGLYGIGLKGGLRDTPAGLVKLINESPGRVVSLDVPSGLGDEYRSGFPVVEADATLTFELPKLCLYLPSGRRFAGKISVLPAGFPPELTRNGPGEIRLSDISILDELLSLPEPSAYKNTRGHLAVFAGAPGTTGAASLASEAALRSGAGLVSLFADREVYPILAAGRGGVMVKPWNPSARPEDWMPGSHTALLAGPGWGRSPERSAWLRRLLSAGLPGVLDADGLYLLKDLLSASPSGLDGWVLTPHPGEFAVLAGVPKEDAADNPLPLMDALCRRLGCVMVLKGHLTIVREPSGVTWIHDGMNPALGTAGSGDVLAGIIAGLLARGLSAPDAAVCGVELHAAAGRTGRDAEGFFLAEDLLPLISREAWRDAQSDR